MINNYLEQVELDFYINLTYRVLEFNQNYILAFCAQQFLENIIKMHETQFSVSIGFLHYTHIVKISIFYIRDVLLNPCTSAYRPTVAYVP